MGDIHYIVDKLNSPPFGYNASLLSFSDKTPQELLQLLSDVFAQISPKHQRFDVSKELVDQTVDRLINFLKIVKYKPSIEPLTFRQLLTAGDKEVIYPILRWVVPQPQVLEKRAYVGHYLSLPDMPEEFNFDGDIMELKEDIKREQAQFIETHKSNEAVKALSKDTLSLKAKIKSLEEEKERLTEKVERATKEVNKIADRANYMKICADLRKEQDEEVNLSVALQNQKQQLDKTGQTFHRVTARLKELQSSHQEGTSARLLETLQADVDNLRFQVNERYPKELEKRQKRAQALGEALANGVNTEMDLQRIQSQANALHNQITEIQERKVATDKQRQGDKAYLQLRQAQQMASMIQRKKDELTAKMDRLQEKKAALTAQFEKLAAVDGGGNGSVSEEEWRLKYESMKAKLPNYKKMKKELGDLEAEVFVLAHSEEVLSSKANSMTDAVKKIERKQGITGFTDVAANLEKVSEAKSQIDEEKGMTLTEISRTVEDINAAINDRKVKLAPQIKKLRAVRTTFSELEAEHTGKKDVYDATVKQFEGRTAALENEVSSLRTELMENESKFHLLHCQLAITDQNVKRVTNGPTAQMLVDNYQKKLTSSEQLIKSLNQKQRDLRDNHNTGLSQIDMMNDLMRLLQLKCDLGLQALGLAPKYSSLGGGGGGGMDNMKSEQPQEFNTGTANVFVL